MDPALIKDLIIHENAKAIGSLMATIPSALSAFTVSVPSYDTPMVCLIHFPQNPLL
jgi:hypothetical protein